MNKTAGFNDTEPEDVESRIRQLEDLLADKSRQLDELTRELDDISFAVSHDFKAPLRAITGFSSILREEQSGRLDEEGNRVLTVIESNAKKLADMINELVENASVSKRAIIYSTINMKKAAEDGIKKVLTAEEKNLLCISIANLPPCNADEKMMHSLWINLLNYVVLYASKNGQLEIAIGYTNEDDVTNYFLKTISPKNVTHSSNNSLTSQQVAYHESIEGTGSGLAFINRVLFKHKGNFWIQSIPGKECVFYFSIPKS